MALVPLSFHCKMASTLTVPTVAPLSLHCKMASTLTVPTVVPLSLHCKMASTLTPLSLHHSGKNLQSYPSPTFKCSKLTFPPSCFRRSAMKPIKKRKKTVVAVLPIITKFISKAKNVLNTIKTVYVKHGWILNLINDIGDATTHLATLFNKLKDFLKKMAQKHGFGGHKKKGEVVKDAEGDEMGKSNRK